MSERKDIMSYSVPYSFIPGTKARAQEVNANFNALTGYCDTFESGKANTSLSNITSDGIEVIKNNSVSRNIGEIIASVIPLSDSGIHLLDGTLLSGSGSYSSFVDFIADLYDSEDYTEIFTTENDWQSSITSYGECGKFVYDSTNNTVRLPKITGIIEGTSDLTTLGDLVEAGLPNITGNVNWKDGGQGHTEVMSSSGALYKDNQANVTYPSSGGTSTNYRGFSIDASLSSSIYGNSTTVQPQTIKVLYYIVVGTNSKTEIQVDIDEIATDLNSKVDKDLANMNPSQSAIDTIMSWVLPDYSSAISFATSGYTAPSNGYIYVVTTANNNNSWDTVYINSVEAYTFKHNDGYAMASSSIIPVAKNDVISFSSNRFGTLKFFPMKGAD